MENANPEKPKVKINLQFFSYIYTNITLFKKKKRIYFHPFSQFGVNVNEGSLGGRFFLGFAIPNFSVQSRFQDKKGTK